MSEPGRIPAAGYATHDVLNQAGAIPAYNAYTGDQALTDAMRALGGNWYDDGLSALGDEIGSPEMAKLAEDANSYTPELETHDRFGNRIDEISFHPAWHVLMSIARNAGVHSLAWTAGACAHTARAGLSYLLNQGENGVCCPTTMTFASIAALRQAPEQLDRFRDAILSADYDPRALPPDQKHALTVGMAMTEKQGGSDLRQVSTLARPAGDRWLLTGHKWFFSVPQSDLFLTLARTEKGVTCFLAQGWLDDGQRNRLLIQRLKDKCGNRSNASAEVEFRDLEALMVGEDGRGIATLINMAHLTRLDCAISSAALMRQALTQVIHHTSHRSAFERRLIDQPLMRNVLADLALDAEAFMWAGMRMAQCLDGGDEDAALSRIAIPMGKYLACKRAPAFVAETLECLGGNGYVETFPLARLYREAPLNGVWEGSGNVICLDVLRSAAKLPDSVTAWLDEVALARGADHRFDQALDAISGRLRDLSDAEPAARRIVSEMGRIFQASLLLRHAPNEIAETFCAARLGDGGGQDYGTLSDMSHASRIIARATVAAGDGGPE